MWYPGQAYQVHIKGQNMYNLFVWQTQTQIASVCQSTKGRFKWENLSQFC